MRHGRYAARVLAGGRSARAERDDVQYEGTYTGEHGVGYGKRQFFLEEVGPIPIDLMRRIKLALDPKRILNPDKVFKIDPNDHEH